MIENENTQLKNKVIKYLEENPETTINELYSLFDGESRKNKENKNTIKEAYKSFDKFKLYYRRTKKNASQIIGDVTPTLKNLIKENSLDYDDKRKIVELTKNNAKIINNLIKEDDNYISFANIIYNSFKENDIKMNKDKALFIVIREIDRDNSTNVWRYNKNRNEFSEVVKYIANNNDFFEKLEKGDENLPDDIVERYGTCLKSLSSKICKYLSEFMFKKDNYYINDKYIRHALLFYLDYYDVKKEKSNGEDIKSTNALDNNFNYFELYTLLEKLRNKAAEFHNNELLTKNELDHIIWYCYKSFKA